MFCTQPQEMCKHASVYTTDNNEKRIRNFFCSLRSFVQAKYVAKVREATGTKKRSSLFQNRIFFFGPGRQACGYRAPRRLLPFKVEDGNAVLKVGRCDIEILRFAICSLQFAVCSLQFAVCSLQFAI